MLLVLYEANESGEVHEGVGFGVAIFQFRVSWWLTYDCHIGIVEPRNLNPTIRLRIMFLLFRACLLVCVGLKGAQLYWSWSTLGQVQAWKGWILQGYLRLCFCSDWLTNIGNANSDWEPEVKDYWESHTGPDTQGIWQDSTRSGTVSKREWPILRW